LPHSLPPDRQGHYRDQYDPRMRSTPLLPLLLSVNYWQEQTRPSEKYPWHDVDFITNRNSIRHLLRILRKPGGSYDRRGIVKDYSRGNFNNPYSQPFRIDVELAGTKTILLNRWDLTASEPLTVNSHGFNFESAFTSDASAVSALDSGETGRHHRTNSYVRKASIRVLLCIWLIDLLPFNIGFWWTEDGSTIRNRCLSSIDTTVITRYWE
jgi:hypothetical protein